MTLYDLYKSEYAVSFINFMRREWCGGEVFDCIGNPKKQHLFLYFDGARATYRMRDGGEIHAETGDFLYIPKGAEYSARFFAEGGGADTLGVNFELWNKEGNLDFPNEIVHLKDEGLGAKMFDIESLSYALTDVPMRYNRILYSIFDRLGASLYSERGGGHSIELIRAGAEYLNKHFSDDTEVSRLAEMCNISEVYFRRLFKEQTGMSPTEYRTHLRLMHARELLEYASIPLSEISERLGFTDPSYFSRRFYEKFGISPLKYRNSNKLES